ncbi:hypothetical protein ACU686_21435 [Yinghuangia aomiensis]
MRKFRPTVLRTLDPDPEHTVTDGKSVVSDHQDHTAAALFAVEALRRYEKDANRPHVVVESYRGYSNAVWPHNQSAAALADKIDLLSVYGLDRPVRLRRQRRLRRPQGRRQSGRLQLGGKHIPPLPGRHLVAATRRRQPAAGLRRLRRPGRDVDRRGGGGAWTGPAVVGAGPFAPFVTAVRLSDGRIRLFAVRMLAAGARTAMSASWRRPWSPRPAWPVRGRPWATPRAAMRSPDAKSACPQPWRCRPAGPPCSCATPTTASASAKHAPGTTGARGRRWAARTSRTGCPCSPPGKAAWKSSPRPARASAGGGAWPAPRTSPKTPPVHCRCPPAR